MYTVYQHINKINGKVYIGMTSRSLKERFGNNGNNYTTSPSFFNAIQEYGWDNFDHIILYEGLTESEACKMEQKMISKFDSMNPEFGYNQASGGNNNFKMAKEAREKLSKSKIGNKNGEGHPCSEEKKRKISEVQKGKKFTQEHREKLSIAAQNRHVPCSEEKGKTLSNSYPNKKQIYCVELDTVYESTQECGRQLEMSASNIVAVCRGRHKSYKGLHFEYYNNDDTINA